MKATFDHSHHETAAITQFWFRPERPLHYTAGQYTELTLRLDNPDDHGSKRWFTLSSAPGGELVSITTKLLDGGRQSSFKQTLFNLTAGTEVDLAEAMGDFVLPKDRSIPLVFVAGGIGITPFHAIAEWLKQTGQRRDIQLIYSAKTENDLIFVADLESVGVKPTIILSDPSDSWAGQRGHLDIERILQPIKLIPNSLLYLSGSEPMVESLGNQLTSNGIAASRIVRDAFLGYKAY